MSRLRLFSKADKRNMKRLREETQPTVLSTDRKPVVMKTDHITGDPKFQQWLHELTIAGYDRNIMIPITHHDAILGIWCLKGDDDIEKCLNHYEDFCRRWKALNNSVTPFNQ